jgi:O-antigen ligase
VPLWVWPFALAWIWGWWPIVNGDVAWATMLTEFKNVFLILPLFVVISVVITQKNEWRPIILVFFGVAVWIAFWGVVEYGYPGIKEWLPNLFRNPTKAKELGFERAGFTFWGSADAAYVCLLALPFSLFIWQQWRSSLARVATSISTLGILYAIYISGHRNTWFLVAFQISVVILLKRRYYIFAAFVLVFLLLPYEGLPDQVRTRFYSGAQLVAGRPVDDDSSGKGRWERVIASFKRLNEKPFGGGWAAGTWVHNDFLQLAENLGLPAGLLLLGTYLWTLQRMLKQVRARSRIGEPPALLIGMFMSFVSAGVIFATDANIQLTQLIAPIWFVWVSSEILLRQFQVSEVAIANGYSYYSAAAYFQLRQATARNVGIN